MSEKKEDVKEEEATPTPVPEEKEQTPEPPKEDKVSEDVKPPEVVDKTVYEKVREDMQAERQAKREANTKNAELETRIAELESRDVEETLEDEDKPQTDPRVDVIYAMNKDPFVKENLDLIETRMSEKGMKINEAILSVKSELFDRIQKEVDAAPSNTPLKQEKPTATEEAQPKEELSADPKADLEKALKGELDIDPAQLEAIKRALPNQK